MPVKKNILVVDDSPIVREMVSRIVEKLGFLPTKAGDGEEALKLAHDCDPHALILDVDMPKLNGLQVLASLRQDERFKATPIIILSGINDEDVVKQSIRDKATAYLLKDDPQVIERLRQHLKAHFG